MSSLLEPVIVGGKLSLRNRVVMGSMTRNRCVDDFKPGPAQVKHYADRARDGVGLIVNEGTFVDWTGCDWDKSPFMMNDDHARAWRLVTDAVHREGKETKIFFQVSYFPTRIPILDILGSVARGFFKRCVGGRVSSLIRHPSKVPKATPKIRKKHAWLTKRSHRRGMQVTADPEQFKKFCHAHLLSLFA